MLSNSFVYQQQYQYLGEAQTFELFSLQTKGFKRFITFCGTFDVNMVPLKNVFRL